MGAGDEVPEALRQLGADVMLLGPDDLAGGQSRAASTPSSPACAPTTYAGGPARQSGTAARLCEERRNAGGAIQRRRRRRQSVRRRSRTLLANIGPYPITTGRERVTVEEAPVQLLNPSKPAAAPAERDYRARFRRLDSGARPVFRIEMGRPHYQPLFETHDPMREAAERQARCTRATARARTSSRRSPGSASCPPEFRARFAFSRIC